jgi:hypothetical protein
VINLSNQSNQVKASDTELDDFLGMNTSAAFANAVRHVCRENQFSIGVVMRMCLMAHLPVMFPEWDETYKNYQALPANAQLLARKVLKKR